MGSSEYDFKFDMADLSEFCDNKLGLALRYMVSYKLANRS